MRKYSEMYHLVTVLQQEHWKGQTLIISHQFPTYILYFQIICNQNILLQISYNPKTDII